MQVKLGEKTAESQVLLSEEQIRVRVAALADEINQKYPHDETVLILIVLHGALIFASDLIRRLHMPTLIETVRLRSYVGTESTGNVQVLTELPAELSLHHVLVVEDIVDSGRSLSCLTAKLREFEPKSLAIATLLDKPEMHQTDIEPEFVGFSIGRNFVIGYGLDYNGSYRNLPYIAEVME